MPLVRVLLTLDHSLDVGLRELLARVFLPVRHDDEDDQTWAILFSHFRQPLAGFVDRPANGIQQSGHAPGNQLVLRHLRNRDAFVEELVFHVKLHQGQQGFARLRGLLLDERVDAPFGVFTHLFHRAAAVNDEGDVGQVRFHGTAFAGAICLFL